MFRGDHPELCRVLHRALASARDLEHPRVGSEHLLLALGTGTGTVSTVLAEHGATAPALRRAVVCAAPAGAAAAVDRDLLAPLGIDLDRLFGSAGTAALDRPPTYEPLLPLGTVDARRRCSRISPPLGLDAQAAYEASLRLALARREPEHRPEHLALSLIALDPGAAWTLLTVGADRQRLAADMARAFPPPRRNLLLRAERRLGRHLRHRDIVRRYQHSTGRAATAAPPVGALTVDERHAIGLPA